MTYPCIVSTCGGSTRVIDSRPTPDGQIVRQRQCARCEVRFNTQEIMVSGPLTVRGYTSPKHHTAKGEPRRRNYPKIVR